MKEKAFISIQFSALTNNNSFVYLKLQVLLHRLFIINIRRFGTKESFFSHVMEKIVV